MGKGRRFELNISKELNQFDEEIVSYPAGYSGSQYGPSPDIILTTPAGAHALELKKVGLDTGDRRTVIKGDEFEMLEKCSNSYTTSWIVIAINNRKTLVKRSNQELEKAIPDCFEPSITKNGNLRLTKPEASDWISKRKQEVSNAELILNQISNFVNGT